MRVGVIGLGGTGGAALRFLAEAGHAATGFEQFCLGHNQGSSHGESRIIRYTYPDLLYTQMMGDAYPLWHALEEAAGEELLVRSGGVVFGPEGNERVLRTEAVLQETGLPYERLTPAEVTARFPALRLAADEIAVYQRESGFLRAGRCVLANLRLARAAGAEVLEETPLREIAPHGAEVVCRDGAGGEWVFDRVIVTAGAWIGRFFPELHLPLAVTRQEIAYLGVARNQEGFAPGRFPVWIDAGEKFYGFPSDDQIEGIKLAANHPGVPVDPDHVERVVEEAWLAKVIEYASRRMPDLAPRVTAASTCLYTNTPDEHFILDRTPGTENIWLASGCSGHGFKFTVLLGKIMADLATGGAYPRDLSRFSARRFAHGL